MTSIEQLQNLLAIRKLKPEPPDIREFDGLLLTAKRMIPDAELEQLSPHSRFQLAYDSALARVPSFGSLHRFSDAATHFELPSGKVAIARQLPPEAQRRPIRRRISGRRAADQRIDCRHQGPSRGSRKTTTHCRVLVIMLCCFSRMRVALESACNC